MGIGPELPPHLRKVTQDDSDSDQDSIGPSSGPSIGPSIGPSFGPIRPEPQEEPESAEAYAPSLPPELVEARRLAREKAQSDGSAPSKRVLGPTLPPSASAARYNYSDSESDDDGMVGPVLPSSADKDSLSKQSKIREFEERAERMRKKLAGVCFFFCYGMFVVDKINCPILDRRRLITTLFAFCNGYRRTKYPQPRRQSRQERSG